MEGDLWIGHVTGHVIEMLPTADVGTVQMPHPIVVIRLDVYRILQGMKIHLMAVIRPVHEPNLAVLQIEGVVGHVQRADGGDLTAERPQDLAIVADTQPEVCVVRAVVERIGAARTRGSCEFPYKKLSH